MSLKSYRKQPRANPAHSGGLLIIVDELGKVLEGAAHEGHDIIFLQNLAELASRSKGRLLFIGILHQSFDEYAQRLTREMRDEWAKIQGRFVDLAVNVAGDEQLELLSHAIERDETFPGVQANRPNRGRCHSSWTARGVQRPRRDTRAVLASASHRSGAPRPLISPTLRSKSTEPFCVLEFG